MATRPHLPIPVRRRGRPSRIGREQILETARAANADDLTMPGLAAALGVTTSALYHYFPNKQALLDALAEEVLTSVQLPSPDDLDWRSWLRALAVACRQVCIDAAPLPAHPTASMRAAGARMLDGTLHALLRDGFDAEAARDANEAVVACAFFWAYMAQVDSRHFGLTEGGVAAMLDETAGELRHREEFIAVTAGYEPEERFHAALELLLDGIAGRRERDRTSRRTS